VKFVFDEHIDPRIARGLQRQHPVDIVEARIALTGMSDPDLLEWATQNDRILVTADVNTLVGFAYQRIQRNVATIGVLVLRRGTSIRDAIEALEIIHALGETREFDNGVWYIPL
jgi:predicted nuclease of predicted toxin-antitoxin system